MKLWSLGSGSRGNAVLLECGSSRVLIDAGYPPRVLARRLALIDVATASIEAVVITHEHDDHVRGAAGAARRWGWGVHATAGTIAACRRLRGTGALALAASRTIGFHDLDIEAIPLSHDAAEPIGIVATERATGARAAIIYDLGCVTATVRTALGGVELLMLESNHDDGMLRAGPYPFIVQERIASRRGHLSNRDAGLAAAECAHGGLGHIVLAHLSEKCNDAALASGTMRKALARTAFRGAVTPAVQDSVVGPFSVGARAGVGPVSVQFALAL